jgi:hypothetical protein
VSFETPIRLPHTDLVVGRIGLGSSFGVGPRGLEIAFDHGINYFYWGSVRRPGFARGIRRLVRTRGREKIAVALQSYARWPGALPCGASAWITPTCWSSAGTTSGRRRR